MSRKRGHPAPDGIRAYYTSNLVDGGVERRLIPQCQRQSTGRGYCMESLESDNAEYRVEIRLYNGVESRKP